MADRKVQTLSRSPTRLVETIYQDTHSVDFGGKKICRLSNLQQSCVQHVATCIDTLYSNSLGRIKPKYPSWNSYFTSVKTGPPTVDSLQCHFLSLFLSN